MGHVGRQARDGTGLHDASKAAWAPLPRVLGITAQRPSDQEAREGPERACGARQAATLAPSASTLRERHSRQRLEQHCDVLVVLASVAEPAATHRSTPLGRQPGEAGVHRGWLTVAVCVRLAATHAPPICEVEKARSVARGDSFRMSRLSVSLKVRFCVVCHAWPRKETWSGWYGRRSANPG